MTRKAIVAMVGESWIDLLSLDEVEIENDKSCGGGGSCGSSGCGCRISGHPFKAAVPENMKLRAGDTVEVSASSVRALGASLIVLGLPVLAAVSAWTAAGSLFPGAGEAARAGTAGLGLAAGAGLAILLGKMKKGNKLPEITAVLG